MSYEDLITIEDRKPADVAKAEMLAREAAIQKAAGNAEAARSLYSQSLGLHPECRECAALRN